MTKFNFTIGNTSKSLEIAVLPNPEIKTLSVSKSNSLEPLEKRKNVTYSPQKGIAIFSVNQAILLEKGISGADFQLVNGMIDYASRSQITSIFIDLIALASSLGQKKNVNALKAALIDILDAQPLDQQLNKEFNGHAYAEFYVGIPEDGDPSREGQINVQWNINLKRVITSQELSQLNKILWENIEKGEKLRYSKQ